MQLLGDPPSFINLPSSATVAMHQDQFHENRLATMGRNPWRQVQVLDLLLY